MPDGPNPEADGAPELKRRRFRTFAPKRDPRPTIRRRQWDKLPPEQQWDMTYSHRIIEDE